MFCIYPVAVRDVLDSSSFLSIPLVYNKDLKSDFVAEYLGKVDNYWNIRFFYVSKTKEACSEPHSLSVIITTKRSLFFCSIIVHHEYLKLRVLYYRYDSW